MRPFIYLIVIGAAAYLGFAFYTGKITTESITGALSETPAAEPATPAPVEPAVTAFRSKIEIPPGAPGEKQLAPPGTFYMLERVSVEIPTGVAAVVPGEPVKLMARKAGGMMKVTSGKFEFEIKESQVTNDLALAQEAERKDFIAHPRPKNPNP